LADLNDLTVPVVYLLDEWDGDDHGGAALVVSVLRLLPALLHGPLVVTSAVRLGGVVVAASSHLDLLPLSATCTTLLGGSRIRWETRSDEHRAGREK